MKAGEIESLVNCMPPLISEVPEHILLGLAHARLIANRDKDLMKSICNKRYKNLNSSVDIEKWQMEKFDRIITIMKRVESSIIQSAREKSAIGKNKKIPLSSMTVTEKCDRGCKHCAVMASASLESMDFEDLRKFSSRIKPAKRILDLGPGENLTYLSRGADLGDVVSFLFENVPGICFGMVTSGISHGSKNSITEEKALDKITKLDERYKQRILVKVSIKSFLRHSEEMALETMVRLIESGVPVKIGAYGYWGLEERISDWRNALLKRLGINPDDCILPMITSQKMIVAGRLANDKEGFMEKLKKVGCRTPKENINRENIFGHYRYNGSCPFQIGLNLHPDGSLGPGCGSWQAPFLVFGHIEEADILKKIHKRKLELKEHLNDVKKKGLTSGGDTCLYCSEWFRGKKGAVHMKDEKRFDRAFPRKTRRRS